MMTKEYKQSMGEKVEQQSGIAQKMGFVNRSAYRKAKYADTRKTRNTSQTQIPTYMMMGGARTSCAPIPPPRKRKKLKGWQKCNHKRGIHIKCGYGK